MQITYLQPPPSHAFEDAYWKETTGPHEPCQGPQASDIIQVTRWALESWAFHYGLPVVKEHNIGGAHPTWAKFCDYIDTKHIEVAHLIEDTYMYLLLLKELGNLLLDFALIVREKQQHAKWPWCRAQGHMMRQLKWKTYVINFHKYECIMYDTKAISHIQIINLLEYWFMCGCSQSFRPIALLQWTLNPKKPRKWKPAGFFLNADKPSNNFGDDSGW